MKPDHPDMLSLRSRIEELDRQLPANVPRPPAAAPIRCLPNIAGR